MEIENGKLEEIMKKLRKLQNLYEGAKAINSEGEANAAAAAIQRILIQYNLTMEQISMEDNSVKTDDFTREDVPGYISKSIGGIWEYELTKVLCSHNFCRCYMRGNVKNLVLFGSKENLEVVKWLRDLLTRKYVALSKERYKEYIDSLPAFQKPIFKSTFQRGYLRGCCDGLDAKLTAEEKTIEQCTALMVVNDERLTKYIHSKVGAIKTTHQRPVSAYDAYQQGVTDGRNTEIYKPIEQNKSKGEIQ